MSPNWPENLRPTFKSAIQNSQGDSKTMWSHVKKLFLKTKSSGIPSLEIDGHLITTPKDIANKFNTFFVSIGENLVNLMAVPSRTALDWLRSSCEAVGDHPANTVRNITFVKVPFSSFMDECNEDVLRT